MKAPKIIVPPPGPKAREIIEKGEKYLVTTTREPYLVIARMENDLIEDVDGNVYIDFAAGIAVANAGHRNKAVVEAIKAQLEKYIHSAPHDFYDDLQYKVAEKLAEITPGNFDKKVFFGNSGTEAVEAAIKIAKVATGRKRFIAFIGAFHGRTHGSLSLTASKPVHQRGLFPTMPGVEHVPYAYCYRCPYRLNPDDCDLWCAKFIDEVLFQTYVPPDEVAAIFVEPIQGEGGYIVPRDGFIQELRKIADKYGILLVADEVQSGFGRSGKMFAVEHFNTIPDIITTAKSIANGVPLGATIIRADLDFKEPGTHSSTFGGNALALAAALANIDFIIKEKLPERAARLGEIALKRLKEAMDEIEIIGDVRGKGLMIGVEIVKKKETKEPYPEGRNKIAEIALRKGLVLLPAGRTAIRVAPPLTITEEHLETGLEILIESIKEVSKETS
ncbi:MAG: acetyl ornithine aminotransferase family protein [Candidatus Njordarchaeales archaeon]